MIATQLDERVPLFRGHNPRWAFDPYSGAGAAKVGGRMNRPGVNALYLALDLPTAVAEYKQDSPLMTPCTIAEYRVSISAVADFSAGYDPDRWNPLWQEWACNWKSLAMLEKIEPPTWELADQVIATGCVGLLFPSTRTTGTNLVLFMDHLREPDWIRVHDPKGDLPASQASWSRDATGHVFTPVGKVRPE